jgi:hypothetical protein
MSLKYKIKLLNTDLKRVILLPAFSEQKRNQTIQIVLQAKPIFLLSDIIIISFILWFGSVQIKNAWGRHVMKVISCISSIYENYNVEMIMMIKMGNSPSKHRPQFTHFQKLENLCKFGLFLVYRSTWTKKI